MHRRSASLTALAVSSTDAKHQADTGTNGTCAVVTAEPIAANAAGRPSIDGS